MHKPYDNRHALMDRVVELRGYGYRLDQIAAMPGMPSRTTMYGWSLQVPVWAAQLAQARAAARGARRHGSAAARPADGVQATRFLARVRAGEAVRTLVAEREGAWVSRAMLNRWKAESPGFAAAFEAAKAEGAHRARGRPRRPFDPRLADQIIARVYKGEPMASIAADPTTPSRPILARWRREQPQFDAALRICLSVWARRGGRNRLCTPDVIERVLEAIIGGASLHGLSKQAGLPHHSTMYGWMRTRPEFAEAVTFAQREQRLGLLDEILAILSGPAGEGPAARRRVSDIRRQIARMRLGARS